MQTTVAIKNRKTETKLFPIIDIIGIISTGKTTFFTKYAYALIDPLAPIILSFKHIHIAIPGKNQTTYGELASPVVLKINWKTTTYIIIKTNGCKNPHILPRLVLANLFLKSFFPNPHKIFRFFIIDFILINQHLNRHRINHIVPDASFSKKQVDFPCLRNNVCSPLSSVTVR